VASEPPRPPYSQPLTMTPDYVLVLAHPVTGSANKVIRYF
jgi:hypothetical protein